MNSDDPESFELSNDYLYNEKKIETSEGKLVSNN
jgi:hypothetical protein